MSYDAKKSSVLGLSFILFSLGGKVSNGFWLYITKYRVDHPQLPLTNSNSSHYPSAQLWCAIKADGNKKTICVAIFITPGVPFSWVSFSSLHLFFPTADIALPEFRSPTVLISACYLSGFTWPSLDTPQHSTQTYQRL